MHENTLAFELSDNQWKADKTINGELHMKENPGYPTQCYPGYSKIIAMLNSSTGDY